MSRDAYQLAIDFGTTNTVACVTTPGSARPQRVKFGDDWRLPSAVLWTDTPVVGVIADRSGRLDPTRYLRCPKRELGHPSVELGGKLVPVVDVIAKVLDTVRQEVLHQYGGPPADVVLTRPVQWAQIRRDMFATAARLAGFSDVRFLEEPVAAAIQVGQLRKERPDTPFAVLDFGGGTLDVAVIVPNGPAFDVLASSGVEWLGGEDVDDLLFHHVLAGLERDGRAAELRNSADPVWAWRRTQLLTSCRYAKEQLSTNDTGALALPDTGENIFVTRSEFDQLVDGVIARIVGVVNETVEQAGFRPSEVPVHLVGGSSPISMLARELQRHGFTVQRLGDPQFVVSEGAALWIAGRAKKGRLIYEGGKKAILEYRRDLTRLADDVQRLADEARKVAQARASETWEAVAEHSRTSSLPVPAIVIAAIVVLLAIVLLAAR